jgi:ParB/RepB/Spo0J family partition protein
METAGGTRKISLAQIVETDNVREDYAELDELAESIRRSGLLQPIAVKSVAGRDAYGIRQYELVVGHRRFRAFKRLFAKGEDFSMIDAVVVSGDKLTLQLIENLQRADLTALERERGIYRMTKDGAVSQREVAALLGKNEIYVSRNIAAYRVRYIAEQAGVDTTALGTYTLCELQAAPMEDYSILVRRLASRGGTASVAREIMREYRGGARVGVNGEFAESGCAVSGRGAGFEQAGAHSRYRAESRACEERRSVHTARTPPDRLQLSNQEG